MYHYFREKPADGDPVSDFAVECSMGEFVARLVQEMPWYINDAQVNLLANGIANDVPTEQDFERAVARMLQVSFLGVVDRFEESLTAGGHFLRPIFPELNCYSEPINVSTGLTGTLEKRVNGLREACDPDVYAELLRLNRYDLKLVDQAREEVLRRFKIASSRGPR